MKNKKVYAILGLTAIAANLGYSSLVLAQSVTGTQTIGCGTVTASFFTGYAPSDFAFDTVNIPSQNQYQSASNTEPYSIQIQADAQGGCDHEISLKVRAVEQFKTDSNSIPPSSPLKSNVNNLYPILSISKNTTVNAGTVQHWNPNYQEEIISDAESAPSAVATNNVFLDAFGTEVKYDSSPTKAVVLLDENGCKHGDIETPCDGTNNKANEVTFFNFNDGFYAQGTDGFLISYSYFIALPRAVSAGEYQTTVVWTLSAS